MRCVSILVNPEKWKHLITMEGEYTIADLPKNVHDYKNSSFLRRLYNTKKRRKSSTVMDLPTMLRATQGSLDKAIPLIHAHLSLYYSSQKSAFETHLDSSSLELNMDSITSLRISLISHNRPRILVLPIATTILLL